MAGAGSGNEPMALWSTLYALKRLPRTGWVDRGIPLAEVESVADHSFFTMLIAWVASHDDASLDANRVLQLALIHDVAEAIAGDMPPYDPEDIPTDPEARRAFFAVRRDRTPGNRARKDAIEAEAATKVMAMLPESVRDTWQRLWNEYEAQESPEAQLVKQVDKLEAFIQSRLYAPRFPDAPVEGFADMARQAITHPLLVPIRDAFLD
jgi:putative hydrolase of HD superfamily